MPPRLSPLDEQQWEAPDVFFSLGMGPSLTAHNVLWYFYNSPFFDPTSNNQALIQQTQPDPAAVQRLFYNGYAFEEALRARFPQGVQFVVTSEPKGEGQPWVVQRQWRQRDNQDGKVKMEVQGIYYTVGWRWIMAPSLLDIVNSRMLTVSTLVQEVFNKGKGMAHWSPATGHTWLPPTYEGARQQTSASRAGSVAPGGIDLEGSQDRMQPQPQASEAQTTEFNDDFFLQSLMLTKNFGTEYMDENPLQGEPGSFVFASTNKQVEARNKAAAAAQSTGAALVIPPKPAADGESATPSVAPTPKPVDAGSRKGSVVGLAGVPKKEKRRKSRGLTSPISPTGGGP